MTRPLAIASMRSGIAVQNCSPAHLTVHRHWWLARRSFQRTVMVSLAQKQRASVVIAQLLQVFSAQSLSQDLTPNALGFRPRNHLLIVPQRKD